MRSATRTLLVAVVGGAMAFSSLGGGAGAEMQTSTEEAKKLEKIERVHLERIERAHRKELGVLVEAFRELVPELKSKDDCEAALRRLRQAAHRMECVDTRARLKIVESLLYARGKVDRELARLTRNKMVLNYETNSAVLSVKMERVESMGERLFRQGR